MEYDPKNPRPDRLGWALQDSSAGPQSEEGGTRIGPYKLVQRLGEGGMGTVWMAEQMEPVRRRVALKLIKPGMDSSNVLARFEAERQALALMDHPNIAKILEAGLTVSTDSSQSQIQNRKAEIPSGRPYFVMELIKGVPITKYCDDQRLSIQERLELFLPVCDAVQHAHQKGIIHRDLKPSNVLIAQYDGKPVPKVIDFGVAKAVGPHLTERTFFTEYGAIIGTLEYMSPEQAELNQLDIDTRSDIYSLGVLFYELLTGTTPLKRETIRQAAFDEILNRIREQDPPKPSTRLSESREALPGISAQRRLGPAQLNRIIRGDLDWIAMKALEKERNRRYETANGLAMDIRRHLQDEPVLAREPTALYRLRKFTRKHKVAAVLATSFVLLLTAATAISSLLAGWANRERAQALSAQRAESLQRARATNAESQAKEHERQAREAEAESRDVLRYFEEKVLAAARPEGQDGGLGRDATIRQAIDWAESELGRSFTNRPLVEASIRQVLGKTYYQIDELPHALTQYHRALALRHDQLGPDHAETLHSMNELGLAYMRQGNFKEARRLFEQVLELLREKAHPDDRDLLTLMNNLATLSGREGNLTNAATLFQQGLELRRAKFGSDDPDTLASMHNLAEAYLRLGKFSDALPLIEEALARRTNKCGRGHPLTLDSMNSLARTYQRVGRLPEALPLFEEAYSLRRANLGPDHADTLKSLVSLGDAWTETGRLNDALSLLEEALPRCRSKLGSKDEHTLHVLNNLAMAYREAGCQQDAVPMLEEVFGNYASERGLNHPITLVAMANLARTYIQVGRRSEGLRLLEEASWRTQAKLGAHHPDSLRVMNNLAVAYRKGGKLSDAIPLAEEVVRLAKSWLGPDHRDTLICMDNLTEAYQLAGRKREGLLLLEQIVKLRTDKLGSDNRETVVSKKKLADAYNAAAR